MKRIIISTLTALLVAGLLISTAAASMVTTPNGTWTSYPEQSASYQTSVQQPINIDGSSNFKANGKAVIPVKFALSSALSPFVFESILSDSSPDNDYSFVSFTPSASVLFNDITGLSSVYTFTLGNCHGGALRWSIRTSATQSVFIYYGDSPNFTDCITNSQSGMNMIGLSDLRYDTSQYAGGNFYDTYAHTQTLIGTTPIIRASLVLDAGWAGDQRLTLTSATFATAAFTDTFIPPSASAFRPVCPTQEATIKVTKAAGIPTGDVNEPISIQAQDNNGIFRIVDCKYMYNLATSSLSGVGTYKVYVVINGTPVLSPAVFDLR